MSGYEGFFIDKFLKLVVKAGASDIHLVEGEPPAMRVGGQIKRIDLPPLTNEDMDTTIRSIAPFHLLDKLTSFYDIDFAYEIAGVSRFRVNMSRQLGKIAMAIRVIPYEIKTFEELDLPPSLVNFTKFNNGIILVTGATGSGKSTTIAAIIDYINKEYAKHIVTIEDPVEFIFSNKKSIISQRQIPLDTESFHDGIKYAMRQDPDVIFIGEIRDKETIEAALEAAETGHLVVSTIHTNTAIQSVERIVNMFEPGEREFVRKQLASTLRGSISQKLVPTIEGRRMPASEIFVVTPTVKDFIERDEMDQIYNLVRKGTFDSMITMNMSLFELYSNEKIDKATALNFSDNKSELEQMMRGVYQGSNGR